MPLSRPLVILFAVLALFISLDGLGDRKLANPDEGRYSEIAREMASTGDFITPRLRWEPVVRYTVTVLLQVPRSPVQVVRPPLHVPRLP